MDGEQREQGTTVQTEEQADSQAVQAEGQQENSQEKKFTQADLNRVLKERIKRERERLLSGKPFSEDLDAREKELTDRAGELTKRETVLSCREYLLNNNYPVELLDIIDTGNLDDFKAKAQKAARLWGTPRRTAPLASTEPLMQDVDVAAVFAGNTKHKPKHFPMMPEDFLF